MKRSLSSLARYENGHPFKPEELGPVGTPVIRIRQLVDSSADVDRHDGELPVRVVIGDGDLIFSWSGSLAVRIWDRGRGYLNQHLFRVDPAAGIDRLWLGRVLEASVPRLEGLMHGSAMTHITRPMLKMVIWSVPTLPEQRRIADFLDDRVARIDRIIAARRAQISALEEAYVAWLGGHIDGLGVRHGWAPLRRFVVAIEQGWSPEADSVPALPGQPGVLKLGAVRGGSFDSGQNKAFLDGTVPREELRVLDGDLLVPR